MISGWSKGNFYFFIYTIQVPWSLLFKIEIVSANNIGNWGKACGNDSNPNAAASAEIQPTLQCWCDSFWILSCNCGWRRLERDWLPRGWCPTRNLDDQIFIVQYLHHCHDPTRSLLDRCQEEVSFYKKMCLPIMTMIKKMIMAETFAPKKLLV